MEKYDYSTNGTVSDEVYILIDQMKPSDAEQAKQALETIKQNAEEQHQKKYIEWIQASVLPAVHNYAEESSSILQIDTNATEQCLVITLSNPTGFDILYNDKQLRTILISADHIGIAQEDGNITLNLIYDYTRG